MFTTTLFVPLLLAAPQGPQFEAPVRMRAGDSPIKVEAPGYAAPCWQDADGDHATDAGELMSLEEAGIASLDTGFVELPFVDANGNLHLERSTATRVDGSSAYVTDVYFNVAREDADAAGIDLSSVADLLGDDGIDLSGASSIGAEDAGSTLDLAGLLASGALDAAAEAASQAADDAADLAAIELLGHQQACEAC